MPSDARTFYTYPTTFGPITIGSNGTAVTAIILGESSLPGLRKPSALTNQAANEIMEYLAGKRTVFTVPCQLAGTAFQQQVWRAVANIPYGQTRTARDLAETLGAPDSFRAVGAALKKCTAPLLVPIHRIVSAAGKPLGSGQAAAVARALLHLEAPTHS